MLRSVEPDLKYIYFCLFGRFRYSNVAPTKLKKVVSAVGSTRPTNIKRPLHLFVIFNYLQLRQPTSRLSVCVIPILRGNLSIYLRTVKILRPFTLLHRAGLTLNYFSEGNVFGKQSDIRFAEFLKKEQ